MYVCMLVVIQVNLQSKEVVVTRNGHSIPEIHSTFIGMYMYYMYVVMCCYQLRICHLDSSSIEAHTPYL